MNYSIALIIFFAGTSCAMDKKEYMSGLGYRKKFDVRSPDVCEPIAPPAEFPECPICFDVVDRAIAPCTMNCGHIFHFDCVKEWTEKNPTCPMCRGDDGGAVQEIERRMAIREVRREVVNTVVSSAMENVADMFCIPAGLRRRIMSENS